MKVKQLPENYWSATPKKWRKIGDALLSVGTSITGFAIYEEMKWVAISALVITVAGKFITNLFSE